MGRLSPATSPAPPTTGSQKYHEQRQDEDDSASQVGVLVRPELVVRAVNELKCHFFLGMAPDTPQTRRVGSGAPRTRGRGPGHGGGASATGRGLRHAGGAPGTGEGPQARGGGPDTGRTLLTRGPMPRGRQRQAWAPGALARAGPWLRLTWSSSHPYRSQCRTTRARCRFQISRNTVAAAEQGGCHVRPWGGSGVAPRVLVQGGPGAQAGPQVLAATYPTEP